MSQTLSELELHTPPLDTARPRRRAWSRWAKWFVCLLIFLWLADRGVSLLIRHTRLQRRLTARLGTVFGRSVEVGSYDFSLWGGPTLQAHAVTFGRLFQPDDDADSGRVDEGQLTQVKDKALRTRVEHLLQGLADSRFLRNVEFADELQSRCGPVAIDSQL